MGEESVLGLQANAQNCYKEIRLIFLGAVLILSARILIVVLMASVVFPRLSNASQVKRVKSSRANASTQPRGGARGKSVKNAAAKGGVAKGAAPADKILTPRAFVDERVTRILRDLKGRAPRVRTVEAMNVALPLWSTKNQWIQTVYNKQLVDASNSTGLLSDKLLFYEVAKRELGLNVDKFLVRTVGLRDFLVSENLVDGEGRLVADGDKIDSALFKVFPGGFSARPAVGVAPRETGRGLFKNTDEFVAELLKTDSYLYRPEHRKRAVRSTVLDEVASGEAIVLQEDLTTKQATKFVWRESRVHTYESRVIADANTNYWIRSGHLSKEEIANSQKFVSDFLALFSPSLLSRQALSFDVLLLPSGELKISDVVSNRGRKVAWSQYLDQPRVIGAYTRHFEQYAGIHFTGISGMLLRKNAGNYFAYWGLRIEKSRPGFEKVLAWIPPWP